MLKKAGWEVWLALGFISLGFIMIGVAWNGAASQNCIQCQLPYVLSGGLGGLALIGLGLTLLLFIAGRRMVVRLEAKHNELIETLREGGEGGPPASSNGSAPPEAKEEPAEGMVIVGRSSFHLPTCRLVEGKTEMDAIPMDDAVARGLDACRVCDPLQPKTAAKPRRTKSRAGRR